MNKIRPFFKAFFQEVECTEKSFFSGLSYAIKYLTLLNII